MPSADPDLELQGAILAQLKTDPAVAALVAGRIFDSVPLDAQFPYVTYGPSDIMNADAECLVGYDIDVQLDVWSRGVGFPEAKRIAGAVRDALHGVDLALPTNALVLLEHRQTSVRRDPDGLTSHAVIQFNSIIEHP